MKVNVFEISFPSEILMLKQVVADIFYFIDIHFPGIACEERGDLKLIFNELLINAIMHGNNQDIDKKVTVTLEATEDMIRAKITDEGCGFDYEKLLTAFDQPENISREHGRGIRLVSKLTDSFTFSPCGNEILFYKKVTTDG